MVNTASISGYDGNFCTGLDFGCMISFFFIYFFIDIFSYRDLPEGKAYLKQAYQMAYTLATMQTPVVSFLDGISCMFF
jgi:enoyl-CoA hydratase/carnithine racemase